MKNKIIASRECIILGIIGFLFTLFGLCVMTNISIMIFDGDERALPIIFLAFTGIIFIELAVLSLLCINIGAYKYWIDDSGFLHKVSIFNVDTKIPIEDIVLIMKIPACRFPEYYLLIEKRFFNQNKNIQRKQSIIICNEINNLFINEIFSKLNNYERALVEMKLMQGLPFNYIAKVLRKPESTIRNHFDKVKEKIKNL